MRASNHAAQALYRAFGFAPAGIRKGYYVETKEDAIVMWANDVDARPTPRLPALEPPGRLEDVPGTTTSRSSTDDRHDGRDGSSSASRRRATRRRRHRRGGTSVLSSVVSSQVDLHARYGGVVPEIASRAHVDLIVPVVAQAFVEAGLSDAGGRRRCEIDAVAATYGPGLVGALLVGRVAAKALALAWDVPFIAVNHLEAHLYAAFLEEPDLELPLVVLLVSGGHTLIVLMEGHGRYRVLGSTIDDAAGEAFDKVARYLGLGYPGGPAIDRLAVDGGDPEAIPFPRAMLDDGTYDFSFSGLKTAVVNHVRKHPERRDRRRGGVVPGGGGRRAGHQGPGGRRDVGAKGLCLGGGVAANSRLRERFLERLRRGRAPRGSCPAGPCAPTTPPWSPAPPGTGGRSDGPTPLDTGATRTSAPLI